MRLAAWLTIPLLLLSSPLVGQPPALPFSKPEYPFVNYDQNRIRCYGDSTAFEVLFRKLDTLLFMGRGQVSIVHFGGSHVQGGTFPMQVMERFQGFHPGTQGARGFLFPYSAASTNTPRGYRSSYSGVWSAVRNVDKDRNTLLGASGIRISTTDTLATFSIIPEQHSLPSYLTETVTILGDTGSSYRIVPDDSASILLRDSAGITTYAYSCSPDTLSFHLERMDTLKRPFHLYGILAGNTEPGITYHALGINGATIAAFHECELLESHLALLEPDLVILSLGINDAYGRRFSPARFRQNYDTLIRAIRKVAPDAAILLTTNNDSYLYRRYVNRNGLLVREAMQDIARDHGAGVWDMFNVMGGLNSINLWYAEGLANRDKVHLTREGYSLIGDLLFEAILRSYGNHLDLLNQAQANP